MIAIFTTAIISALIGWGKIHRVLLYLLHAEICIWLTGSMLGAIPSIAMWTLFRTGAQAKMQLSAMDTINNSAHAKYAVKASEQFMIPCVLVWIVCVVQSIYLHSESVLLYPLTLIPALLVPHWSLSICNYSTKLGQHLGWNNGHFIDCRRFNEFMIGLAPAGLAVSILIRVIKEVL